MSTQRKAPPGKFIIGEADMSEGGWGQVGGTYDTLEDALAAGSTCKKSASPEFDYFVYDENGLVQEVQQIAV